MRLISARDTRDAPRPEWDDMGFLQYYEVLKKADDQYVAPRKNAQDTSINLGTIRDKDTSLVEYAASHDFEPVAQVFDNEDDLYEELAEIGEDLVRKSFLLDGGENGGQWKDKAKHIYRSMISFGTALVEDLYVQRWVIDKTIKSGFRPGMGTDSVEWEQRMKLSYDGCQAKLWDLRKCYFGDIRKFFMNGPQGQPYFFTVEYESYDVVKQYFGNWDRFKYVPNIVVPTPEISSPLVFSPFWTLRPVSMNYVEIIRYYDPVANEFALTLNGVDMLPLMKRTVKEDGGEKTLISGFPLTEVSPSGAIPFAKYDLEPMHDFAYSKGQPAKMRVAADVENMLYKLFIQMLKQKAKPTMGNKGGRNFGPEVTDPGTIINDIRDGDLFPVLPNFSGAVPADFSFFELTKKELDKNSIERSWQGMGATVSDETATKDLNDRKAQTLKVAAMFDGIISGNCQLYWLRTFNIMKNWTKPVDQQVDVLRKQITQKYRTVTLSSEEAGGQRVKKKIIFTKDTPKLKKGKKRASLDDSFDVMDEEEKNKTEFGGGELRLAYLHPELFASARMNWFYDCVAIPNDSDPLSYMLFAKQVQDAAMMFGPDSLNVKKLKHRFSKLTGNDFDTWFINEMELQTQRQQAAAGMTPPGAPGAPTPSLPGTPAPAPAIPGQKPGGNPSPAGPMLSSNPSLAMGALIK